VETLGENAFENGELKEVFRNTALGREYYEKKKRIDTIKLAAERKSIAFPIMVKKFTSTRLIKTNTI